MSAELVARIQKIDDKQAIYAVQKLAEAVFKHKTPPSVEKLADVFDTACENAGIELRLGENEGWNKMQLGEADAGELARAVLSGWAVDPGLEPAVEAALDRFKTPKQDFGILSVGAAVGLTYALMAMDADINLGFIKVKKRGLSGKQQVEVIKKTVRPIAELLGKLSIS